MGEVALVSFLAEMLGRCIWSFTYTWGTVPDWSPGGDWCGQGRYDSCVSCKHFRHVWRLLSPCNCAAAGAAPFLLRITSEATSPRPAARLEPCHTFTTAEIIRCKEHFGGTCSARTRRCDADVDRTGRCCLPSFTCMQQALESATSMFSCNSNSSAYRDLAASRSEPFARTC